MIMTSPESFKHTSKLFVWGSNTRSEIGLSEQLVAENKKDYHRVGNQSFLSKPIQHKEGFEDKVAAVACGCQISLAVYMTDEVQRVVQMGSCKIKR